MANGGGYTGSIEYNYYLYGKDGKMSMISWDYDFNEGNGVG